jgi:Domain of unknown function (DUF4367)
MNQNKTVTINGQQYDAHTGLPVVQAVVSAPTKKPTHAASVHSTPQKSQTLIRRATKKPTATVARPARSSGRSMDIARSSSVSRFAPHPVAAPKKPVHTPDIAPAHHPIVTRAAAARPTSPVVSATKSSKQVKEDAIAKALAAPPVKHVKKSFLKRHPRALSIVSISIIVAIVGSYITYVNLPSLSVKVAAAQAGIDASYPEYRPDGYSIDGPVTFSDGQVSIHFVANTGSSTFTIKQSQSSWDSSAVLDNVVREKVGEKYITSQERGLTIYTYNGNAAWVNAGILYTIEGDAPLSGEQIRRIATSL